MTENYISLNKISSRYLSDVQEYFKNTWIAIDTNLSCKSFSEWLLLDIIIYLWGAIVSWITYDWVKNWIKALFNKHPNWSITIIWKGNIMFNVKWDLTVNVVVVPDRKREFENIKNIDDAIEYIKKQIQEEAKNNA